MKIVNIDLNSNPTSAIVIALIGGYEVEIDFDRSGEVIERDSEERFRAEILIGSDNSGKMYSAIGEFFCDELETIRDLELG